MQNTDNTNQQPAFPTMDPVEEITKLLQQSGHQNPEAWKEYLNKDALEVTTPVEVKRFLVNRAWRTILGTVPTTAPAERFCLIDQGDEKVWLQLFKESIIPVVVEFDLPRPWSEIAQQ